MPARGAAWAVAAWGGADPAPDRGDRRRVARLRGAGAPDPAAMRFEVPAGTALVFSGSDGELLAEPMTRPILRTVEVDPER